MLYTLTTTYFNADPEDGDKHTAALNVFGIKNARGYADQIAKCANVIGVNVIDGFTGELVYETDGYSSVVY